MTAHTAGIDRFVRWFFNSSPDLTEIEPCVQPSQQAWLLRHGALIGGSTVALILLLVFYSVVVSAVERATERHAAAQAEAILAQQRTWQRQRVAAERSPQRVVQFAPRTVSYLRPVNAVSYPRP
ncbi:MAG: hypothetical protein ABI699_05905 [Caldimonas sp.]